LKRYIKTLDQNNSLLD